MRVQGPYQVAILAATQTPHGINEARRGTDEGVVSYSPMNRIQVVDLMVCSGATSYQCQMIQHLPLFPKPS
ncbi:unnamed protein product [Lathyrus oleraceus]